MRFALHVWRSTLQGAVSLWDCSRVLSLNLSSSCFFFLGRTEHPWRCQTSRLVSNIDSRFVFSAVTVYSRHIWPVTVRRCSILQVRQSRHRCKDGNRESGAGAQDKMTVKRLIVFYCEPSNVRLNLSAFNRIQKIRPPPHTPDILYAVVYDVK